MRLQLLGPVAVVDDGGHTHTPGRLAGRLAAVLALAGSQPVSPARLADCLWEESPPPTWKNTLQVHVSSLRRGPLFLPVEHASGGYRFSRGRVSTDVHDFDLARQRGVGTLLAAGITEPGMLADSSESVREALADLERSAALWRGEPLSEYADDAWAQVHIARLEAARLTNWEHLINAQLALGRNADAAEAAARLTAEAPLRETFWEQLILAQARCGHTAEALGAFRAARTCLRDELGLDPGPRLLRLHADLLPAEPPGAEDDVHPPSGTDKPPLLGREREIQELRRRLASPGLVTLTGPGGVGKTRLAVEVVHQQHKADSVVYVTLSSSTEPEQVLAATARACGVSPSERPLDELIRESAAAAPRLWLFDNCEHLLPTVAGLVDLILVSAPDASVLATSREPLHLAYEQVIRVKPLPVPRDGLMSELESSAAVALLRAHADRAGRPLPLETPHLRDLVARLDGLPLALEIVGARLALFTPSEVLRHFENADLLGVTPGYGDSTERHSSLWATIDWSYTRLSADERSALCRLALFSSTFDLAAVEAIDPSRKAFRALPALADKGLIDNSHRDGSGVTRLRLLQTVRSFLHRRCTAPATRDDELGLARHFRDRLPPLPLGGLMAPLDASVLDLLAADMDNYRSASATFQSAGLWNHAADLIVRMTVVSMHRGLWHQQVPALYHVIDWHTAGAKGALSGERPSDQVAAEAHACLASFAAQRGDHASTATHATASHLLSNGVDDPALSLRAVGLEIAGLRHLEDPSLIDQGARLTSLVPDRASLAFYRLCCGIASHLVGDLEAAKKQTLMAARLAKAADAPGVAQVAAYSLSEYALCLGRNSEALFWAERAVAEAARLGSKPLLVSSQSNLATSQIAPGSAHRAALSLTALLTSVGMSGDRRHLAESVLRLACAHMALGDEQRAGILYGAYLASIETESWEPWPSEIALANQHGLAEAASSRSEFKEWAQVGRSQSLGEATDFAGSDFAP